MKKLIVSDCRENAKSVLYIYSALGELLPECGASARLAEGKLRCELELTAEDGYFGLVRGEAEERAAEVVAVGYKYDFFARRVRPYGLRGLERELLLSALISADLVEDRRYVLGKLKKEGDEIVLDGIYHFLLAPLREKWTEIAGYIPCAFASGQLRDFVVYLLGEKPRRRAYVEGSAVYDEHYCPLRRTFLTGGGDEGRIVREILLSGATEVELSSPVGGQDEKYLRLYFGGNVFFAPSAGRKV